MVTIDLTTPPAPPASFLDGMARRLALTLPELRLVADLAGGAPLPFDLQPTEGATAGAGSLSGRLGASRGSTEDSAYTDALGTLHDPDDTLRRRGPGHRRGRRPRPPRRGRPAGHAPAGARPRRRGRRHPGEGLAPPVRRRGREPVHLRRHRLRDRVVPGRPVDRRAGPRHRGPRGPAADRLRTCPALLDVPYALADAVGEAIRSGRSDLVPVLMSQAEGDGPRRRRGPRRGRGQRGRCPPSTPRAAAGCASSPPRSPRARRPRSGVVSWVLLDDGWHSLTPRHDDGARVSVARVEPDDLPDRARPGAGPGLDPRGRHPR